MVHDNIPPGQDEDLQALQRARDVSEALHSVETAGLPVGYPTLVDVAEYVDGRLTVDELGRRIRARHGVRPPSSN